ncbi:MAG: hypothetical protein CL559_14130 [Alphaproteobacteria bacterium]|nr:hypothetical protein [Alphaproteobacteria bacterium]
MQEAHSDVEVNALTPPQHLILWVIRTWFRGMALGEEALPVIEQSFAATGMPEVIDDVDEFFSMLACGAMGPYSIGCSSCLYLHRFEICVINALAAFQQNQWDKATHMLEAYIKPDEAYMAGPPARRFAMTMSAMNWIIHPLIMAQEEAETPPGAVVIPFPKRPCRKD